MPASPVTSCAPRAKRGRPRTEDSPDALATRKLAALKLMAGKLTREEIATEVGVTTRTLRRWQNETLAADGEIPDMLRAQKRIDERERGHSV